MSTCEHLVMPFGYSKNPFKGVTPPGVAKRLSEQWTELGADGWQLVAMTPE